MSSVFVTLLLKSTVICTNEIRIVIVVLVSFGIHALIEFDAIREFYDDEKLVVIQMYTSPEETKTNKDTHTHPVKLRCARWPPSRPSTTALFSFTKIKCLPLRIMNKSSVHNMRCI
jgi:hypothetical protein